jgi:hypothetical protein
MEIEKFAAVFRTMRNTTVHRSGHMTHVTITNLLPPFLNLDVPELNINLS